MLFVLLKRSKHYTGKNSPEGMSQFRVIHCHHCYVLIGSSYLSCGYLKISEHMKTKLFGWLDSSTG